MPAITANNLSKCYKLGLTHAGSVRELANGLVRKLWQRPAPVLQRVPPEHASRVDEDGNFWALKDVSFEIQTGEVVGIIGKNGAGKSTLLKILSRITSPTSGRITLQGRVASLLEVGTGFHPELTGRENVYLNGTILGMSRREIDRQFDDIVDFAGVSGFIDTPVKRYSSGMTVRLGFAVAAHLNPEILIVDEVLAVGDAEFQKRCLGKMQEVSDSGRTVLLVSHNLTSIAALSTRVLVLCDGRLSFNGNPLEGLAHYREQTMPEEHDSASLDDCDRPDWVQGGIRFQQAEFVEDTSKLYSRRTALLRLIVQAGVAERNPLLSMTITSSSGQPVASGFFKLSQHFEQGTTIEIRLAVTTPRLVPGKYYYSMAISSERMAGKQVYDAVLRTLDFDVPQEVLSAKVWSESWGFVEMDHELLSVIEVSRSTETSDHTISGEQ